MSKTFNRFLSENHGASVLRFSILALGIFSLIISNMSGGSAQGVSGASDDSHIIKIQHRPVLELTVRKQSPDVIIFPGAVIDLTIEVANIGLDTAKGCLLKIEDPFSVLIINNLSTNPIDLAPGQSFTNHIQVEFPDFLNVGWIYLSFLVSEANGFNLFPERIINFEVTEPPQLEVVVSDFAIQDQFGRGYFEPFQNVRIFLRIQNCSFQAYNEVQARIEFAQGLNIRELNPNFILGSLEPGEYRDINALVATTAFRETVDFTVFLDFDGRNFEQRLHLEPLQQYNSPSEMSEDNCLNAFSSLAGNLSDGQDDSSENDDDVLNYPPLTTDPGKFAVIMRVSSYIVISDIEESNEIVNEFIDHLVEHMGYPRQNIQLLMNFMENDLSSLKDHHQLSSMQQRWRRYRGDKELTFYYLGYASTDRHNGKVFLLPANFNPILSLGRVNIDNIYEVLQHWRGRYNFNKVNAYFNIHFIEESKGGIVPDKEFSYVRLQREIPQITSFVSSTHNRLGTMRDVRSFYLFNNYVIRGLRGEADFNRDGRISAFELYRFMVDELQGIPGHYEDSFIDAFTPVFWGQDIGIY